MLLPVVPLPPLRGPPSPQAGQAFGLRHIRFPRRNEGGSDPIVALAYSV